MNALAFLGIPSKAEFEALKKELDELKKTVNTHHKEGSNNGFSDQDPYEFAGMIDTDKISGRDKRGLLEKHGFGK